MDEGDNDDDHRKTVLVVAEIVKHVVEVFEVLNKN